MRVITGVLVAEGWEVSVTVGSSLGVSEARGVRVAERVGVGVGMLTFGT